MVLTADKGVTLIVMDKSQYVDTLCFVTYFADYDVKCHFTVINVTYLHIVDFDLII